MTSPISGAGGLAGTSNLADITPIPSGKDAAGIDDASSILLDTAEEARKRDAAFEALLQSGVDTIDADFSPAMQTLMDQISSLPLDDGTKTIALDKSVQKWCSSNGVELPGASKFTRFQLAELQDGMTTAMQQKVDKLMAGSTSDAEGEAALAALSGADVNDPEYGAVMSLLDSVISFAEGDPQKKIDLNGNYDKENNPAANLTAVLTWCNSYGLSYEGPDGGQKMEFTLDELTRLKSKIDAGVKEGVAGGPEFRAALADLQSAMQQVEQGPVALPESVVNWCNAQKPPVALPKDIERVNGQEFLSLEAAMKRAVGIKPREDLAPKATDAEYKAACAELQKAIDSLKDDKALVQKGSLKALSTWLEKAQYLFPEVTLNRPGLKGILAAVQSKAGEVQQEKPIDPKLKESYDSAMEKLQATIITCKEGLGAKDEESSTQTLPGETWQWCVQNEIPGLPENGDVELDAAQLDAIAKSMQQKFEELTGVKPGGTASETAPASTGGKDPAYDAAIADLQKTIRELPEGETAHLPSSALQYCQDRGVDKAMPQGFPDLEKEVLTHDQLVQVQEMMGLKQKKSLDTPINKNLCNDSKLLHDSVEEAWDALQALVDAEGGAIPEEVTQFAAQHNIKIAGGATTPATKPKKTTAPEETERTEDADETEEAEKADETDSAEETERTEDADDPSNPSASSSVSGTREQWRTAINTWVLGQVDKLLNNKFDETGADYAERASGDLLQTFEQLIDELDANGSDNFVDAAEDMESQIEDNEAGTMELPGDAQTFLAANGVTVTDTAVTREQFDNFYDQMKRIQTNKLNAMLGLLAVKPPAGATPVELVPISSSDGIIGDLNYQPVDAPEVVSEAEGDQASLEKALSDIRAGLQLLDGGPNGDGNPPYDDTQTITLPQDTVLYLKSRNIMISQDENGMGIANRPMLQACLDELDPAASAGAVGSLADDPVAASVLLEIETLIASGQEPVQLSSDAVAWLSQNGVDGLNADGSVTQGDLAALQGWLQSKGVTAASATVPSDPGRGAADATADSVLQEIETLLAGGTEPYQLSPAAVAWLGNHGVDGLDAEGYVTAADLESLRGFLQQQGAVSNPPAGTDTTGAEDISEPTDGTQGAQGAEEPTETAETDTTETASSNPEEPPVSTTPTKPTTPIAPTTPTGNTAPASAATVLQEVSDLLAGGMEPYQLSQASVAWLQSQNAEGLNPKGYVTQEQLLYLQEILPGLVQGSAAPETPATAATDSADDAVPVPTFQSVMDELDTLLADPFANGLLLSAPAASWLEDTENGIDLSWMELETPLKETPLSQDQLQALRAVLQETQNGSGA